MQFIWYGALPILLLIPLFFTGYWWIQHRRTRYPLRYSSLFIVSQAVEKNHRIRRHIPPVVFLGAVSCMLLALTRPYTLVPGSESGAIVILTIDNSASMMGVDIAPSRLEAAKSAARDFVMQQSPKLRIGIVAFSDSASIVQIPTTNHAAVLAAVDRLKTESSTAIGSGILTSLFAIAGESASGNVSQVMELQTVDSDPSEDGKLSGAIVLLTDGQNEVGPSPIEAAEEAARRGVRIYTVGIGTNNSRVSRRSNVRQSFDEGTLTQIADLTHGKFFRAYSEASLSEIYKNLRPQVNIKKEKAELAPGLTALAIVMVLAGATLSYRWNGGIP